MAALAFAAGSAHAISLGDIQVRSHLGQALDATIPVQGAGLDALDDACFAIVRLSPPGLPFVEHGAVKLERSGANTVVRVRSAAPLREPALMLGIRAACPGQQGVVLREYAVLLDPVGTDSGLRLAVRPGAAAPAAIVPAAVVSADAAPRGGARAQASSPNAGPRAHASNRHRAAPRSAPHVPQRPAAPFRLKLSGPSIDLAATRTLDDASRAKLRERLAVLQSDDDMAALLAMRDRMTHLETEVTELQLRVSQLTSLASRSAQPASAAAPVPPAAAAKPLEREAAAAASVPSRLPRAAGLVLAILLALVAVGLAWALRRRAKREAFVDDASPVPPLRTMAAADDRAERGPTANEPVVEPILEPALEPAAQPEIVVAEPIRPVPDGLESLPMDDTDAVIRAARLYYEEGALLRAVQVLQLAVDRQPERERPWLALLELLRREGLVVDHAELAARFRELHGAGDAWRKVQYFGREIDPANPLYRDAEPRPLEFDPVAESWLDMPSSFDEALATELRHSLVRGAARAHAADPASHVVG